MEWSKPLHEFPKTAELVEQTLKEIVEHREELFQKAKECIGEKRIFFSFSVLAWSLICKLVTLFAACKLMSCWFAGVVCGCIKVCGLHGVACVFSHKTNCKHLHCSEGFFPV